MADIAAARDEIQKVVAFLVPRFGPQEDVFKHLTMALANLEDDPKPRRQPKKPVAEGPPVAAAPTSTPRRTRRYNR
jgi:hypothetical protein